MILDIAQFIGREQPVWTELADTLDRIEIDPYRRMSLPELQRFQYLYERNSADLTQMSEWVSEPEIKSYLVALVARAYAEIHEVRTRSLRFSPWRWFTVTFPAVFRKNLRAFKLSVSATLVGCAFGALALIFDPEAKEVLLPFGHLQGDPAERVREEEQQTLDTLQGRKASFSAYLMTHNTRVSIFTMSLGVTWGVGTMIMLFYNGIILGAVVADYVAAGQSVFLVGWLLPHGSIEIPAILIAGQAGFVLAGAMVGRGRRRPLKRRMREVLPDMVTLIGGVGVLLIWAGLVESFFSQYHQPALPYGLKIAVGVLELGALAVFLSRSGKRAAQAEADEEAAA